LEAVGLRLMGETDLAVSGTNFSAKDLLVLRVGVSAGLGADLLWPACSLKLIARNTLWNFDLVSCPATYTQQAAMPPPMSARNEAGHIWMVTGPAGCGKTTVAAHLSKSLGLPYLEGDNVRHTWHFMQHGH